MKKVLPFLLLALLGAVLLPARSSDDFSRAIAYYLIGDIDQARKNFDSHFSRFPQPTVKLGFVQLLQDEKWEATKRFRDYLESDHRSLEALTGISLSTADLKTSISIENLNKLLRMNPGYAPAYLCLGNEYLLRRNYPAAEEYFAKSLKYAAVGEFKILLAELYFKTSQPQKALDLIRPEADAYPANYYYAMQAARACFGLGNWPDTSRYLEQALGARPESREAQLLKAQVLLQTGDLRKAKAVLGKLKFNYYNPEYSLACAEVLVKLNDRDAEKYLYEVFSQNPWQPAINKLLGLFHMKKKSGNVQNWIRRALLSGLPPQELQREFPAQFSFAAPPGLPIFEAKKIQWLGNRRLLVAGPMESGEKEQLLVVDPVTLKTIKSFEYEGSIQDMFPSPRMDKVLFSTTAAENEKVYIYTLIATGDTYKLRPVIGYALSMPTIQAAFNESGTEAYVTDGSLADLAFASPFSAISSYGRKTSVYPEYPFPVFSYTYANDRWAQVKNRDSLRGIPIRWLQRYFQVASAYQASADVARLLDRGRDLNITSSEEMKIHFGDSGDHFLIIFADLKNAFQAWAYDRRSNRLSKFDETMFMGQKYYAELDIVAFRPETTEILVRSRDKERNLVHFNYRSLLYKKIGGGVLTAGAAPDLSSIYVLSERNKYFYFSESALDVIRLSPFARTRIDSRRDLNAIVDCTDRNAVYFTTYNGELVQLDEAGEFALSQVSLAGALFQPSPDKTKAAAFINGRLYVLDWMR